jgi:cytochrome c oxidase assembly protein subunit 15
VNANTQIKFNPWLHWFAVLTAVATFLLIGLGGLVTSHEAGMSVPDWPTSYGYNMFALPIKFWTGGAFFEHTHRLLASAVGLLTTVLAVWLWLKDSRRWMTWLGIAAFFGVVAQGVLGGLRVTMHMDSLGIFHGAIAQAFLVLICAMALFTSRAWLERAAQKIISVPCGLRSHVLFVTVLIFLQLLIGATMRHQHAGLAISDFPLAHGKIWPATDAVAIASYNAERMETSNVNPITAFQVVLQMVHRGAALLIFAGAAAAAGLALKRLGKKDFLTKLAGFWLALILAQIGLGVWTLWSNKAADIATLHVMVGALSLVTGALWCLVAFGRLEPLAETKSAVVFDANPALAGSK